MVATPQAPTNEDIGEQWQPTATLANLRRRSEILTQIRQFFAERGIIEVETPLLSHTTVTNPYIQSFNTQSCPFEHGKGTTCYLQTSPEYAMKRLLAAGSGSIYQITKAFRNEESGQRHNPEFSILEWYHVGFDHYQLMDEMTELLTRILHVTQIQRFTYQQLFEHYLGLNPHQSSHEQLIACAKQHNLTINDNNLDYDTWLDILMTHLIEPQLKSEPIVFVYNFPASQAALAKINRDQNGNLIAERFEVYASGMELANGFNELTDATEQRQRFEDENHQRQNKNLPLIPIDELFLAALEHGLPTCAGVALGIDRLMMAALKVDSIAEVMSFSFSNA